MVSRCRLRVYRRGETEAIVEFAESYVPGVGVKNPGLSITNSAWTLPGTARHRLGDTALAGAKDVAFLERYHDVGGSRFAWIETRRLGGWSCAPDEDMLALLGPEAVAE